MKEQLKLVFASLLLPVVAGCSSAEAGSSHPDREVVEPARTIALAGWVTDAAQVLSAEEEAALSAKLEAFEQATRHQMVVVTVPTLGGEEIAAFTRRLANSWGIGRKDYNDGVVLLIAPRERKARIAVGYGLEKKLPDMIAKQIMDQQMIPRFRDGDLSGGIDAGVDALIGTLKNG